MEVETHPAIAEAAAVGVPDARRGHEIGVHVVPRPGELVDPTALIAYLHERLPAFMVPRYVKVAPSLPRTHNGKVMKHKLAIDPHDAGIWDRDIHARPARDSS